MSELIDYDMLRDDMSTEEITEAWDKITDAIGDLRGIIDHKLELLGVDFNDFDKMKELYRNINALPYETRDLLLLHDSVWDAY